MPRVTVIGIGSPFGDDRAGWRLAENLAGSAEAGAAAIVVCRSPASELPGLLAAAEVAILVDAVASGGAPGTVYRLSGPHWPAWVNGPVSSHGLGLQAMLELLKTLEDLPAELLVYGIEADSVAAESTMSPAVQRAVSRVTAEIERDIRYYCRGFGNKKAARRPQNCCYC